MATISVGVVLGVLLAQFGGSEPAITPTSISEQLLGEYFSMETLVITENRSTVDGLTLMGSRLRFSSVSSGAYLVFDSNIGMVCGAAFKLAAGGALWADFIVSSQADRPVRVSQSHGLGIVCAAALTGTCGSGTIVEGTTQCLQATGTSRTRYCTCTSNGAGTPVWAWALDWGAGTVGDATTCPEVTP
jgi:hypothetical protein